MESALVLGVGPTGLGAIRGLAKAGITVDLIAYTPKDVALKSRLVRRRSWLGPSDKETQLLHLLTNWPESKQVLIPTSDWYVSFLEKYKTQLQQKFHFVLPPDALSEHFIDKKLELDLVSPWVALPESISAPTAEPGDILQKLRLPLIIKPRSHCMNTLGKKNQVIHSEEELRDFCTHFSSKMDTFVIQEVIPGGDDHLWVCNCTFDKNSELVQAFTFKRLRLTPPHFGVTCFAISQTRNDVIEQVRALGKGLKYTGPAMVEFKFDARDNSYRYIELNPRLGMCNYFDTQAGQNNVAAAFCVSLDKPVISQVQQKDGLWFASVYEDIYSRYRDKYSFFATFRDYVKALKEGVVFIYFCKEDPLPAFWLAKEQIKTLINTLFAKFSKERSHG